MIRQAIAATAESCCDGAVAAALVLCSRAALRAGAESVFAEELEQKLFSCIFSYLFGLFYVRFGLFLVLVLVEFVIVGQ